MKNLFNRTLSILLVLSVLVSVSLITAIPASASSTQITGKSTLSQTVYTGPSTGLYATAGSISANETVYILGSVKNLGWYHIQYNVGSTGKQKTGYVPSFTITNITGGTVQDEIYNGGLRKSVNNYTVYSCDDSALSVSIGSISADETVTLLYAYQYSDSSKSYLVAYIEYSTSSKAKRGYVYYPNFIDNITGTNAVTSVARMKNSANVYYGPGTTGYAVAGSITAHEFVCVVCKQGDWVYVEYNTNSGRKRGYLSSGYLDYHVPGLNYRDIYDFDSFVYPDQPMSGSMTIYSGPGTYYSSKTVSGYTIDTVRTFTQDPSWHYIVYYDSSNNHYSGWYHY